MALSPHQQAGHFRPDLFDHERALTILRGYLDESPGIWTLTTYGRGDVDWVRLFVISENRIEDITFFAVRTFGNAKLKPEGWPLRGVGYNKGQDAADSAWRAAYGESIPNDMWHEL